MADEARCGSCGEPVPPGRFCVRCGAVLGADPASAPRSSGRREFAAAPHQRLNVPRLVSTLFPHLPRASMHGFRVGLAAGTTLVLALAALRLFPVALIAAATLVPLLTALYLYDVDLYEHEPLRVLALTMLTGGVGGVVVGLLARTWGETGTSILTASQSHVVLIQGVLLPALGVALALAGPLLLLPYRRFNDVLDGVTFGATSAAALAGAVTVTYGLPLLGAGLAPEGKIVPWMVRLLAIGVASPVLWMASLGAACAALWLRWRAPVRDRAALGWLGQPAAAIPLAAVLIIAGSALEPLLAVGWWLAVLVALDALALLWLRRAIHLGLLEEAAELPIGPPLTCPNCAAQTPRHSFCISCGISLQALPKPGASPGPLPAGPPSEAPA